MLRVWIYKSQILLQKRKKMRGKGNANTRIGRKFETRGTQCANLKVFVQFTAMPVRYGITVKP